MKKTCTFQIHEQVVACSGREGNVPEHSGVGSSALKGEGRGQQQQRQEEQEQLCSGCRSGEGDRV